MKGPGETELETDRRIVRDKIALLKGSWKRLISNRIPNERTEAKWYGFHWWVIPMWANPQS